MFALPLSKFPLAIILSCALPGAEEYTLGKDSEPHPVPKGMVTKPGRWVWSFQVEPDGSLANGQPLYRLETSDESPSSGADGMILMVIFM